MWSPVWFKKWSDQVAVNHTLWLILIIQHPFVQLLFFSLCKLLGFWLHVVKKITLNHRTVRNVFNDIQASDTASFYTDFIQTKSLPEAAVTIWSPSASALQWRGFVHCQVTHSLHIKRFRKLKPCPEVNMFLIELSCFIFKVQLHFCFMLQRPLWTISVPITTLEMSQIFSLRHRGTRKYFSVKKKVV